MRKIFWITGILSFMISPIADNLTTALLMGAVIMAVGGSNKKFIVVACVNIVVAANAGGAFSPFGDITTLMVWQNGKVQFTEFFAIFIPSLVNWVVPAVFMAMAVGSGQPEAMEEIMKDRMPLLWAGRAISTRHTRRFATACSSMQSSSCSFSPR